MFCLSNPYGRLAAAVLINAAGVALALAASPVRAAGEADETAIAQLQDVAQAFRRVAKRARPGVVHISVSGDNTDEEQRAQLRERLRELDPNLPERYLRELLKPRRSSFGSGVVLDADGHILTNAHVVENRERLDVTLPDDRQFRAELVGVDAKTDVAVVKIDADGLVPLDFADSDQVQVGDWAIAVGAPFGLSHTVTHGIISATGRSQVSGVDIMYQNFLQTDAAINPGNSGGPLLNLRGEVIGLNTAIATHGDGVNAGIAFTIPSNLALKIARQLIDSGAVTRGWLGVSMSDLTPADVDIFDIPTPRGVFIERILADTPADKAGLQVEDIIVRVNSAPIVDIQSIRNLIADLPPGRGVTLDVVRDGRSERLRVQLGEQPEVLGGLGGGAASRRIDDLDAFVRTMRPPLAPIYGFDRDARGVLIIRTDGGAVASALTPGDLIASCNGAPVRTVGDLQAALRAVPEGDAIELGLRDADGAARTVYLNRP